MSRIYSRSGLNAGVSPIDSSHSSTLKAMAAIYSATIKAINYTSHIFTLLLYKASPLFKQELAYRLAHAVPFCIFTIPEQRAGLHELSCLLSRK